MDPCLVVITGGPGSGKTSLVEGLAMQGIRTMPEAGRAIIRAQHAIGGPALPSRDPIAFAEQMLGWELRSYAEAADRPELTLFDRGIPDIIGHLRLCSLPVPDHVLTAARLHRYARRIFLAPHWPSIYHGDDERTQSEAEAAATCAIMRRVYAELGYEVIDLPFVPLSERIAFVRSQLGH
ncbi:ATPase [Sphingobium lactosutens]|nr:ATPase [Sphingobium lactosutens]